MPDDNAHLDQMQAAYKAAVEEWIAAIKEEEASLGQSFDCRSRQMGSGALQRR